MLKTLLKVVPWISYSNVLDAEGRVIATSSCVGHQQVAREITRRCNLYSKLIALKQQADELSQIVWGKYGDEIPAEFVVSLMQVDKTIGEIEAIPQAEEIA